MEGQEAPSTRLPGVKVDQNEVWRRSDILEPRFGGKMLEIHVSIETQERVKCSKHARLQRLVVVTEVRPLTWLP